MRITALFLLAFFSYGLIRAQEISGNAIDSTGKPLSFATVALKKASDSAVAKYTTTDVYGQYKFSRVAAGHYFISIDAVGYFKAGSDVFDIKEDSFRVPAIMARFSGLLKEVHVTATKPLLQVQRDRIIMNVDGNINAAGEDAL